MTFSLRVCVCGKVSRVVSGTGATLWQGFHRMTYRWLKDLQDSWQAQHFEDLHRHLAWQAQRFRRVVLRVLANRNVKAASSGGNVYIAWQAWDILRVYFTPYIPHVTLHTTLYTPHSALCNSILHVALYTPHRALYIFFLHFTLCTLHFTLHTLHSALHTPQSPLQTL